MSFSFDQGNKKTVSFMFEVILSGAKTNVQVKTWLHICK